MIEERIEKMKRMEDFSYTTEQGTVNHMDLSLMRRMSEEEKRQITDAFNRLVQELCIKYARKPAPEARA